MEEKEFRSQLMESMKLARKQGMCLSEEQIHSFFPDIQQGSEQMGFLLEYYKNQKIGVGDRKEVEEYLSMEDRNYLEEYLNGISALESMEPEELKRSCFLRSQVIRMPKRYCFSSFCQRQQSLQSCMRGRV